LDTEARTPLHGEHTDTFIHRVRSYFGPPSRSTIKEETARLANFAVHFSLRKSRMSDCSRIESCLRRCISRMHEKHSMVFGGMMVRLNINRNIDFYEGFHEVSEELFKEEVNWPKIVALFAFGARLAQFCQDNDMEDQLLKISESLARFSNQHLLNFIQDQGGWESLCDVFPPDDEMETQMWKTLGIIAVGLASASAYLILRKSS